MRLLVIEDDEKIASFVVKGLKQAGHAVDRASDGESGLARLLREAFPTGGAGEGTVAR